MPVDEGSGRTRTGPDSDEKKAPDAGGRDDGPALGETRKVMKAVYRGEREEPVTLDELLKMGEIKKGASRPVPWKLLSTPDRW